MCAYETSLFSGFLFYGVPGSSFSGRVEIRLGHSVFQGP